MNDPFQFEDYNDPKVTEYFGRMTGMGNRGYSVLKMLRQDMFDQHWNNLPGSGRVPEVAGAQCGWSEPRDWGCEIKGPQGIIYCAICPPSGSLQGCVACGWPEPRAMC